MRIILLMSLIGCLRAEAQCLPPRPLWILSGQSNMCGAGLVSEEPGNDVSLASVAYWYRDMDGSAVVSAESSDWVPLAPVGGAFGPEVSFGVNAPSRSVILKTCFLGASIRSWTDPALHPATVAAYEAAVNEAASDWGHTYWKVAGYIWVQGHSDTVSDAYGIAYESLLTDFITQERKRFDDPALPFIISSAPSGWSARDGYDEFVASQQAVTAANAHTYLVDASDLELKIDDTHFTSASQVELGERLAAQANATCVICQ